MRETVSVNKAIQKGHLMVNVPVVIVLLGCPALAYYLSTNDTIPVWGIAIGFVIGFLLAWLIWSYMITKWRIWAYENVRNLHELKKRAVEAKLIWEDGNAFEKTEIRNWEDKRKLKRLEKKFEREDIVREDYTMPPKMEIYYAKSNMRIECVVAILAIAFGAYLLSKMSGENKHYFYGFVGIAYGIYLLQKNVRRLKDNKPHIVIDDKGIQTKNVNFKSWDAITEEQVITEGFGKHTTSYLMYIYDLDDFEKIEITDLNVTHKELEAILKNYRIRYTKNNY